MDSTLKSMMTDSVASEMAQEFAGRIEEFKKLKDATTRVEREAIGATDHSFDLSKGKVEGEKPNTWFSFDFKPDSTSYRFLKAMFDHDLSNEEENDVDDHLTKVAQLMVDNHVDQIREVARTVVLPDPPEEAVPMETIKVLGIEMVDYSSISDFNKRIIKYHKFPNAQSNMASVSQAVTEASDLNPNLSIEEIVNMERIAGNPAFEGILSASVGDKYLWDASIVMFVDYSFSDEVIEANTTGP